MGLGQIAVWILGIVVALGAAGGVAFGVYKALAWAGPKIVQGILWVIDLARLGARVAALEASLTRIEVSLMKHPQKMLKEHEGVFWGRAEVQREGSPKNSPYCPWCYQHGLANPMAVVNHGKGQHPWHLSCEDPSRHTKGCYRYLTQDAHRYCSQELELDGL